MHPLPHHLYRAAQVRELDRLAIEEYGIPAVALMERAGAAAFGVLQWRWPDVRRIAVLCGTGNNGGDGYVLARLARAAGYDVDVFHLGMPRDPRGAAARAADALIASGPPAVAWDRQPLYDYELVIDAIFGTGLDRVVSGVARKAIDAVNAGGVKVLALDVPSGLDADTGHVLGAAIRADITVTFIGLKQGQFTADGLDCCGAVHYSGLEVPNEIFSRVSPSAIRYGMDSLEGLLAPRPRNSHKGQYGHVLLIGGERGMSGAVLLAAEAALRTGAGLVSIATRAEHAALLGIRCPEVMSHGIEDSAGLRGLIERATVVAIGPGLGRSAWARGLLGYVLETRRPLVVDADALNLIAGEPQRRDDWILTPHPGEAGRLLDSTTDEVQRNRFAAVEGLQKRYGGVVVLKGAGTLVCSGDRVIGLCAAGNPGMAAGGMGDVLTGIIAGLVAQRIDLADAACLGALLHAEAGDRAAATSGQRGLIASDLLARLPRLINPQAHR
jgi:ADP-dependent NAD(P)H-hydrate dehydratase / NAD(P)H-hydrate epimerase